MAKNLRTNQADPKIVVLIKKNEYGSDFPSRQGIKSHLAGAKKEEGCNAVASDGRPRHGSQPETRPVNSLHHLILSIVDFRPRNHVVEVIRPPHAAGANRVI